MIILQFLRMFGDAAFYYSCAAYVTNAIGDSFILPGLLIPPICFAFSYLLRDNRNYRLAVLLPEILCFVLPQLSWADRIAAIPVVCYTIYLAWKGNYQLSRYRQIDAFNLYWKVYLCFFILMCVLDGFSYLVKYSLPLVVTTLLVYIFLLRVLRHDPENYNNPKFLVRNLLPLAIIAVIAWILQIPAVLNALINAVLAVYNVTIAPLIAGIGYLLGYGVMVVLTPLDLLTENMESDSTTLDIMDFSDMTEGIESGSSVVADVFFWIVRHLAMLAVIVFVIIVIIYVFKRLSGRKDKTYESTVKSEESRSEDAEATVSRPKDMPTSPRSPVNQVRRQYRKYLKLCLSKGFTPHESDTSKEISEHTRSFFSNPEPAEDLREIYLEARYNGSATKEDAAKAKKLVNELKEQIPKQE